MVQVCQHQPTTFDLKKLNVTWIEGGGSQSHQYNREIDYSYRIHSAAALKNCDEFVQPGITAPTLNLPLLGQSPPAEQPHQGTQDGVDHQGRCTLCTGKDCREYKERDALRKHCQASHSAKEGLGTNPRVHTQEFPHDRMRLPASRLLDMVLPILQGTVKRDKNSLNNDSYKEDVATVHVTPLHNEDPVNNPLIQSAIATGNLRRIALDLFIAEEFGVLVCISYGILVDVSSCVAHVQKYHSQVDRSTSLVASRALLNLNVVNQLTLLWNNKVILECIDRDNNKLASFTPIPGWAVQMAPLAPYSPDPSLQLTEMQKASLQMLLADAFTSVPALNLPEELPPWILGCDFQHVDPRHRSG
ncbi:hypothetical protein BJ742DRAFT_737895 [Cladochytrium replicatum]|nr:hypothetical protein BJ742DRAFT_737895 [Cladochytrium replicatum]